MGLRASAAPFEIRDADDFDDDFDATIAPARRPDAQPDGADDDADPTQPAPTRRQRLAERAAVRSQGRRDALEAVRQRPAILGGALGLLLLVVVIIGRGATSHHQASVPVRSVTRAVPTSTVVPHRARTGRPRLPAAARHARLTPAPTTATKPSSHRVADHSRRHGARRAVREGHHDRVHRPAAHHPASPAISAPSSPAPVITAAPAAPAPVAPVPSAPRPSTSAYDQEFGLDG